MKKITRKQLLAMRRAPAWDNKRAHHEGWSLRLNDDYGFQIERLDDPDAFIADGEIDRMPRHAFADDDAALWYVRYRAERGSRYHTAALNYIADHNHDRYPDEPGIEIGAPMDHESDCGTMP